MADRQPLQRPTFVDIYDEPVSRRYAAAPRLGVLVAGVIAIGMLSFGCALLARAIALGHRGVAVQAEVVAARHGSKADYVTVWLPEPLNRTADLVSWSGDPEPGDILTVRYDPKSPATAMQAGTLPWGEVSWLFVGAGGAALVCWRAAVKPR